MKLSAAEKQLHQETVKALCGPAKRLYMARVAETLGRGGPTLLQRELRVEPHDHPQREPRTAQWLNLCGRLYRTRSPAGRSTVAQPAG